MEIKPDAKWKTKQWTNMLLYTLFIALLAIPFHILLPLSEKLDAFQVGVVVWSIALLLTLPGWLFFIIWVPLYYNNLMYYIEDDRITIAKGILTKVKKNIPYRAITDFLLQRSIVDRMLGIGSIMIQTAGQSQAATGYEGNLSGLVNYEELHGQLLTKLKSLQAQTSPTGVAETSTESEPLNQEVILKQMLEELKAIRKALSK